MSSKEKPKLTKMDYTRVAELVKKYCSKMILEDGSNQYLKIAEHAAEMGNNGLAEVIRSRSKQLKNIRDGRERDAYALLLEIQMDVQHPLRFQQTAGDVSSQEKEMGYIRDLHKMVGGLLSLDEGIHRFKLEVGLTRGIDEIVKRMSNTPHDEREAGLYQARKELGMLTMIEKLGTRERTAPKRYGDEGRTG